MSIPAAVVVSVGAAPPAHLTVAGHVTVLLPVPSCIKTKSKLHGLLGAVKVKVSF